MRIVISAGSEIEAARVSRLLRFTLTQVDEYLDEARLEIKPLVDPLGVELTKCRAEALMSGGDRICLEEIQSNRDLAVHRAFERLRKTVLRRIPRVGHSVSL